MLDKVKELIEEVHLFKATSKTDIETFRIKYLGSKGILKGLFSEFKNVDAELRKEFGQALNTLKKSAEDKVTFLTTSIENSEEDKKFYGDLTRPSEPIQLGSRHPISLVKNQIIEVTFAANQLAWPGIPLLLHCPPHNHGVSGAFVRGNAMEYSGVLALWGHLGIRHQRSSRNLAWNGLS